MPSIPVDRQCGGSATPAASTTTAAAICARTTAASASASTGASGTALSLLATCAPGWLARHGQHRVARHRNHAGDAEKNNTRSRHPGHRQDSAQKHHHQHAPAKLERLGRPSSAGLARRLRTEPHMRVRPDFGGWLLAELTLIELERPGVSTQELFRLGRPAVGWRVMNLAPQRVAAEILPVVTRVCQVQVPDLVNLLRGR